MANNAHISKISSWDVMLYCRLLSYVINAIWLVVTKAAEERTDPPFRMASKRNLREA
jgi:hypothetical protein